MNHWRSTVARPPTHSTKGYADDRNQWQAGDTLQFTLPLPVQRVTAVPEIATTQSKVAVRSRPLVYGVSVDQTCIGQFDPTSELRHEIEGKMLNGVVVIDGNFTNGSPLVAIPNYTHLNRGGRWIVWFSSKWIDQVDLER